MRKTLPITLVSLALCSAASATLVDYSYTFDSGLQNSGSIPNGDGNTWTDTRSFSGLEGEVYNVQVSLSISGGNNSDLYAYLSHGGQTVVLLNRVGVGSATPLGYNVAGMNVTLADSGNQNIHWYGGGAMVNGTYAPDGRAIDPNSSPSAFDAAGTTSFSMFGGGNPNGGWTLYISDSVAGGSGATLNSWSLDITAVPEPTNVALGIFAGLFGIAGVCRTERVRRMFRPVS